MKDAFELGRSFAPKEDVDLWVDARGIHKGGISIGEEYYETDPWSKREDVIRELKGYLAGIIGGLKKTILLLGLKSKVSL